MTWQWILAGLVLSVIVVTAVLFVVRRAWVVRVSNATIIVQAGLVLTAWLLIATMPEKRDFSGGVGDTCPDLDTLQGIALWVVAVASLAIAGISVMSGVVSVVRRAGRAGRLLAGLATGGLCLLIWVPLILAAFCGFN
jgi:hypothetical protein